MATKSKKEPEYRLCAEQGCKKKAIKHRTTCDACKMRKHRQAHPHKYAYDMIKKSAKRRNIEFTITLEYFIDFCNKTGYMEGKGPMAGDLTVDRIKGNLGYIPGNLQVITRSENVIKSNLGDNCDDCMPEPSTVKIEENHTEIFVTSQQDPAPLPF